MKKNIISGILTLIFTVFTFIACDDTITGKDIDSRIIPAANVSYSQHIQPVFEVKCNISACHEDAARAGGIALTSWAQAVADPSVIFPGEPQNSRLIWAIDPNYAAVSPMPPLGYPPLTANQIEGIRTWIAEGAKNN
jgi:hypothetical protein